MAKISKRKRDVKTTLKSARNYASRKGSGDLGVTQLNIK